MSASGIEPIAGHGLLRRRVLLGYAVVLYLFLFAPIVLLIVFSFNANRFGTFPITGWTTSWYGQVFSDYQIRNALATSLAVAVQVMLISTVIGTAGAFPLARANIRFRHGVRLLFTLPIMIPGLLIGVSLLVLLRSTLKIELSQETAVLGQCVYTTPFVLLLVAARLQGFDRALERAAGDLGAPPIATLRRIVLPLVFPAVVVSALLTLTLSLDEFVITYFLIGSDNTLPIYIYTQVKFGITPEVNALTALLLGASLLLLLVASTLPTLLRRARKIVA